ncbi:MAG: hypothetical protein OEX02_16700 [Cyclobacteriaceae bacterium]|nr:hypothetical protein [Cyclobacteriaceae bacterium]
MSRFYLLSMLVWCLVSADVLGGEMVLQGVYRGKDIFVRNPYNPASHSFCTSKIFVNDKLVVDQPKVSAIKVSLSHLQSGDIVVVKIIYLDGCTPVVVNPHVLQEPTGFRFLSSMASNNSIDWETQGEQEEGMFVVEQWVVKPRTEGWEKLIEMPAKGDLGRNRYSALPDHVPGENKYRIRYDRVEREPVYSLEVKYTSTKNPITFYPFAVTTQITFSEEVAYEITDRNGRLMKKGEGRTVVLQELRPGEYYVHFQNRTEKFVKK